MIKHQIINKSKSLKLHHDQIGLTSLLIMSKTYEVEPLRLDEISEYFLENRFSQQDVLISEINMRKANADQIELVTTFDFLMFYMKVLKLTCQFEMSRLKQ